MRRKSIWMKGVEVFGRVQHGLACGSVLNGIRADIHLFLARNTPSDDGVDGVNVGVERCQNGPLEQPGRHMRVLSMKRCAKPGYTRSINASKERVGRRN